MSTYPTIHWEETEGLLRAIDQRSLPHEVVLEDIPDIESATTAIHDMHVRGAPLHVVVGSDIAPSTKYAFDVTPACLVTGLITERGICASDDLKSMFREFGDSGKHDG